jgi:uncharacterized membrane protein (UPF0136 family)
MSAPRPLLQKAASILAGLYGLVSITFGIIGFTSKGSVASIVAGGIAGALLILAAAAIYRKPIWSLLGAAIVSIALLARFVPTVVNAESGMSMSELKLLTATVMSAGGALVLLASALALGSRSGSSCGGCGQ